MDTRINPRETSRPAIQPAVTQLPAAQPRRGAVGKALLVYIGTGSLVAAIGAYLLFGAMGC